MLKKIKSLLLSLTTVAKHLFRKPVTLEYPEKKNNLNKYFRGKPVLNNCTHCGTCIKVCPTGAIKIKANTFTIDLKKCIFCGNCEYYCPNKGIVLSKDYELATDSKNDLELNYNLRSLNNDDGN